MPKRSSGILMYRRIARFQAEWTPVSRPESALTLGVGARSDAKPVSTFAERAPHTGIELLLVHPGGPFWAKKEWGAWSIPKGEYSAAEDALAVAKREFEEETGARPDGDFLPLGDVVQPGRKIVTAWGLEGDFDPATLRSNRFELEWPPKSGRKQSFPEVDRARWFSPADARRKILPGQSEFITRLLKAIGK
jgi:predicted NUDIX family NTP pyrophosphohydrolase